MSPWRFSPVDLDALEKLNRLRTRRPGAELDALEDYFSSKFGADHRLAVYGSLAPGRSNHHQLSSLRGEWISGCTVHGEFVHEGWGSDLGHPALRWSRSGPPVPVELFVSLQLPEHWERLDRFEGQDYTRCLVPLFENTRVVAVANLYAAGSRVETGERRES